MGFDEPHNPIGDLLRIACDGGQGVADFVGHFGNCAIVGCSIPIGRFAHPAKNSRRIHAWLDDNGIDAGLRKLKAQCLGDGLERELDRKSVV